MVSRTLAAVGVVLMVAWPGPVRADGFPNVQCTLSADRSRMLVVASNTTGKVYSCLAECRLRVAGQRAFDPYKCTFALHANAAEKTVCLHKGSGPGYFFEVDTSQFTCVPS